MDYNKLTGVVVLDDLLAGIVHVNERYGQLIISQGRDTSDGAYLPLSSIQFQLAGLAITIHAIVGNNVNRTFPEVEQSMRGLLPDEFDPGRIATDFWRLSLAAMSHFDIDTLFQAVLSALGKPRGRTGFGRNMAELRQAVTLKDVTAFDDRLNAFTHLRNSFHNRCVHRGQDMSTTVCGMAFHFRRDQKIACASFGHVFAMLDGCVDVLEDVLTSPEVVAVGRIAEL